MTYLESSKKFLPQKMPHLLLGQGMSQNLKEMTSDAERKKQLTNCQSVILFCNITKEKFVNRQQAKIPSFPELQFFTLFS